MLILTYKYTLAKRDYSRGFGITCSRLLQVTDECKDLCLWYGQNGCQHFCKLNPILFSCCGNGVNAETPACYESVFLGRGCKLPATTTTVAPTSSVLESSSVYAYSSQAETSSIGTTTSGINEVKTSGRGSTLPNQSATSSQVSTNPVEVTNSLSLISSSSTGSFVSTLLITSTSQTQPQTRQLTNPITRFTSNASTGTREIAQNYTSTESSTLQQTWTSIPYKGSPTSTIISTISSGHTTQHERWTTTSPIEQTSFAVHQPGFCPPSTRVCKVW